VSGSNDRTIRVWDANLGSEIVAPLRRHETRVTSVAFTCDGTRIVSASLNQICVWEATTGLEVLLIQGHRDGFKSVAISPDGTRIVSGSLHNKTVRVWDMKMGTEILPTLQGMIALFYRLCSILMAPTLSLARLTIQSELGMLSQVLKSPRCCEDLEETLIPWHSHLTGLELFLDRMTAQSDYGMRTQVVTEILDNVFEIWTCRLHKDLGIL